MSSSSSLFPCRKMSAMSDVVLGNVDNLFPVVRTQKKGAANIHLHVEKKEEGGRPAADHRIHGFNVGIKRAPPHPSSTSVLTPKREPGAPGHCGLTFLNWIGIFQGVTFSEYTHHTSRWRSMAYMRGGPQWWWGGGRGFTSCFNSVSPPLPPFSWILKMNIT